MPEDHCPAISPVTAVDDQFGTHRLLGGVPIEFGQQGYSLCTARKDPATVAEDGSKEAHRAGRHGGKMAENRSAVSLVVASGRPGSSSSRWWPWPPAVTFGLSSRRRDASQVRESSKLDARARKTMALLYRRLLALGLWRHIRSVERGSDHRSWRRPLHNPNRYGHPEVIGTLQDWRAVCARRRVPEAVHPPSRPDVARPIHRPHG
jgi:hypothetical protein